MGAAIAQKFSQEGFKVILADRAMNFVEKGMSNIRSMLNEGVERRVMTAAQADSFMNRITGTDKLQSLSGCDLVVEAIFENFDAKRSLFKDLCEIVSDECIIATNTSSYSIGELSASVEKPSRFIGLHFFYHAAKNRLVEVIPGKDTSPEVFEKVREFAITAGKDPITCLDKYGFAVNRFFVPWLNESVRLLEEGIASKETIDYVCCKVFGIGMGPFALMNATGVPVAYHAEKTLEAFGKLYHVSPLLQTQALANKQWEMHGEVTAAVEADKEKKIRERMFGAVFFVCSQMLDEKVCTATDLNRGSKIGLRWRRGPVDLMKSAGRHEVQRLITDTAERYDMKMPSSINEKYWNLETVRLEINGNRAVITMDEPETMNALSVETMKQLGDRFREANNDTRVKTIYITGSGKAFVAGADIRFFINNIKNNKIVDIESFTAAGQNLFDEIDKSPKLVVAVLNGLTLGGGMELALCADHIIALPKAQLAFPETGIGIYPGLGGTQRLARRIGKGLAKYLVLTGKMLTADEAQEIGLTDKVISMEEMFNLFKSEAALPDFTIGRKADKWLGFERFFDKNSLSKILENNYIAGDISDDDARKLTSAMKRKAPIALKLADQLIEEAKGCSSELTYLNKIFSTSDALLGLSSIGKSVQFTGK